jgi:RHS repeat-associated protein
LSKGFADGTAETYGYDDLSRLISAAYPGGRNVTYHYDLVGNRQSMIEAGVVGGGTTTYQYSDFNQLLSLTGPAGTTNFQYDPNGNQTQKAEPLATTTLTWDARDRLSVAITPTGTSRFGYDPEGLRVAINDSQGSRLVVLDGIEELAEYDTSSGMRRARFDHDATRVDALLAQLTSQGKDFFVTDALGSIYGLQDESGVQTGRYSYDVFGASTAQVDQVPTSWGFAGRRRETWSPTMLYLRQRLLDSMVGTFTQPDPLEHAHIDRYPYAFQNPVRATDPLGLFTVAYYGSATPVYEFQAFVNGTLDEFHIGNEISPSEFEDKFREMVQELHIFEKNVGPNLVPASDVAYFPVVPINSKDDLFYDLVIRQFYGAPEGITNILYVGHALYETGKYAHALAATLQTGGDIYPEEFAQIVQIALGKKRPPHVGIIACFSAQYIAPAISNALDTNVFAMYSRGFLVGQFNAGGLHKLVLTHAEFQGFYP